MPRRARKQSSTSIYHVMSRGLNKLPVFEEIRERSRMLNLIRENVEKYNVEIYAYCIMSNHFHLLIKADLKELASFMAKIIAEFARYYNQKHNRVGFVFQGRYKSQCVENIGYFWNCLRYIHNNPLYLEEIDRIENYKYSSLKELYYNEKDILADIVFQLVYGKFGESKEFLRFHETGSWEVFEDVSEEKEDDRLRIAREILSQYELSKGVEAIEILDYFTFRKEYQKELIKILHVPVKKANEIISMLKRELKKGTG